MTGRPHFARVMVEKGYVSGYREAFDRYLDESAIAYVVRDEPTFEEAVQRLRDAGGLASLAHPMRLGKKSAEEEERTIERMVDAGPAGDRGLALGPQRHGLAALPAAGAQVRTAGDRRFGLPRRSQAGRGARPGRGQPQHPAVGAGESAGTAEAGAPLTVSGPAINSVRRMPSATTLLSAGENAAEVISPASLSPASTLAPRSRCLLRFDGQARQHSG